ncbi:MAG: right-handed parallel beta-helix repeat-containing protein [Candidatus Brocadia sp.]|nr:right-handed parallel beta-helix repeat-containing protein [Candidatus Brocadia sp.]
MNRGDAVRLNDLIPAPATKIPDVLSDSAFRFNVGPTPGKYTLGMKLNPDSAQVQIYAILYDCQLRPIKAWNSMSGILDGSAEIESGVYKLSLTCKGVLGENYSFELCLDGKESEILETKETIEDENIPALHMELSETAVKEWESLLAVARKKIAEAGGLGQPARELPNQAVKASILHPGHQMSNISISLSGAGFPGHFNEETSSFTVRINAGPLYKGMSRFKLYSIRVKEGLLDYVVGSILQDEGLFVPRWLLLHLVVNGKSKGIYVLEEIPSQPFFENTTYYDGRIFGRAVEDGKNKEYYTPKTSADIHGNNPLPEDFDYSEVFQRHVNQNTFAKTLAFFTRFQLTHGMSVSDFRFYQHSFLLEFEPIVRDLNTDLFPALSMGFRGFLVHTSWWYGKRQIGYNAHYTPHTFPSKNPIPDYIFTEDTLHLATINQSINLFVRIPSNREMFEKYLFYAVDKSFRRRFAKRLQDTYKVCKSYLGTDEGWVSNQVNTVNNQDTVVTQYIPGLVKNSYILIYECPIGVNETDFIFYNLSPFSARMHLPRYAHTIAPSEQSSSSITEREHYLAPSDLFGMVFTEDILSKSKKELFLTRNGAEGILDLEKLRYLDDKGTIRETLNAPFVHVRIDNTRKKDFFKFLNGVKRSRWANGNIRITRQKFKFVTTLKTKFNPTYVTKNINEIYEDNFNELEHNKKNCGDRIHYLERISSLPIKTKGPNSKDAYLFDGKSYLKTNISISNWQGFTASLWLNVSAALKDNEYSIVFDFNHTDKKNGVLQFTSHPQEGFVCLAWYVGGRGIVVPIEIKKWHHITATGDYQSREIKIFVNGKLANCSISPNPLWEADARITVGEFTSTTGRKLRGSISGLNFYDVDLSHKQYSELWRELHGIQNNDKLVIYPIDTIPTNSGYLINYIIANQAATEVEIDLSKLNPVYVNGEPMQVIRRRGWTVLSNRGVHTDFLRLGRMPLDGGLPSNLWTGVLCGLRNYSLEYGISNIAFFQLEVACDNVSKIEFSTIPDVSNGGMAKYINTIYSSDKNEIPVVIHEPYKSFLLPKEGQIMDAASDIYKAARFEFADSSLLTEVIDPGIDGSKRIRFKSNTVTISKTLMVPAGYILDILPGTTLFFEKDSGLLIYGGLFAIGTEQNPIRMESVFGADSWRGLALVRSFGENKMKYVIMNKASGGRMGPHLFSGGLSVYGAQIDISNCKFINFISNDGIHIYKSFYHIENSLLEGSKDDGLDSDWSFGAIGNSVFAKTGGDAVDFSGSYATLSNNTFAKAQDKGVSVGEKSIVVLNNNKLIRNKIGLAIKDQSTVYSNNNDIMENNIGIVTYIKKPTFTYPSFSMKGSRLAGNGKQIVEKPKNIWTAEFN